jgi:outer membrane protein assembly factor BamE
MKKWFMGLAGALLLASLLGGCLRVYTPEVQQGNVVTQKMIDQLKIGMSRRQVRFILGTPLVEDPFHKERWDYYFFRKRGKRSREQRKLSLFFEDDRLVEIRGNVKPKATDPTTTGAI